MFKDSRTYFIILLSKSKIFTYIKFFKDKVNQTLYDVYRQHTHIYGDQEENHIDEVMENQNQLEAVLPLSSKPPYNHPQQFVFQLFHCQGSSLWL